MHKQRPLPIWAQIAGWSFSLALLIWHGAHIRSTGKLPLQVNTWRPIPSALTPFLPPAIERPVGENVWASGHYNPNGEFVTDAFIIDNGVERRTHDTVGRIIWRERSRR